MGKEGYHSLYRWYQAFEAEHFPDPKGLRDTVAHWTLHLYPGCIRAVMAIFDVPEAIAVSRTAMCVGSQALELTRLQVSMIVVAGGVPVYQAGCCLLVCCQRDCRDQDCPPVHHATVASHHVQAAAYYLGMLAYYWVLATPAVGFLFGCYLYVSVGWFEVHYDEAFSALRIPHFKGFSRIHIDGSGDLHVYGLGMDKVKVSKQSWGMPAPDRGCCCGPHDLPSS